MPALVESDVLIAERENQRGALAVIDKLAHKGLSISIVTYFEVSSGALRGPAQRSSQT